MGLLERVDRARRPGRELAWPVGRGAAPMDGPYGHDQSLFSPEEYGNYIATSNDIYSVVSMRARMVQGLSLELFKGRGTRKRRVETGPAPKLLQSVNDFWTFPRLQRMDEMSMGIWGETVWACERQPGQPPTAIWWVKPTRIRPVIDETRYLRGYMYEPEFGGEPIPFRTDEIVWFRYPNPVDEFSPLSPLAAARLAADTSSAMMRANANLHRQGLQAGGVIVPTSDRIVFSEEQAKDLEKLLATRWTKTENAQRWSVLRFDAQFRPMNVTPKDAEFLGGLNLTLRQVCNAYGMPTPLLNDMEHATLANAREIERWAWSNALKPDQQLRAAEIDEQFLPMFAGARDAPDHAEFNFDGVEALQEAKSESWGRDRQAVEIGALTINEVRESKGLPPVPWGDVWWAPVNKSAVASAEDHPEGDTSPTGEDDGDQADEDELARRRALARSWSEQQQMRRFMSTAFGDVSGGN